MRKEYIVSKMEQLTTQFESNQAEIVKMQEQQKEIRENAMAQIEELSKQVGEANQVQLQLQGRYAAFQEMLQDLEAVEEGPIEDNKEVR